MIVICDYVFSILAVKNLIVICNTFSRFLTKKTNFACLNKKKSKRVKHFNCVYNKYYIVTQEESKYFENNIMSK